MVDRPIGMDLIPTEPNRWDIRVDGDEIRNLQKAVDVTEDEWEIVRDTAAKIMSQCPQPTGVARRATGLALGKVQSGKTLSYTALTALAVDNGYRITVVLAGTKNPLLEQNYNRLCNDLEVASRPRLTAFKNPIPQEADVINSVLLNGGHALLVVLKNRMRLDNVRRVLSTPELRGFPTLIIDDEGDEASLNTQFHSNRRSAVYDSIMRLRGAIRTHAYIAYTATPQANLLIDGIDGLSPDFGILIQPGQGYCGGSVFFGQDRDRYVRTVPVDEVDSSHVTSILDGLRLAIATFLVGGAIRHIREPLVWHSMLVHNSNLRADHEALQTNVRNLIVLWRETLALPSSDPANADLLSIFRRAYDDLAATSPNTPSWEQVVQRLSEEIRLEVWMVNSLPLGRDPVGTPFRLSNNILVGGNMLGRGVTIPGLAVTYITRRAQQETNADTMEQRARWFGYKESYLDVFRIFLSSQLRDDYTELLRHEDDFWDALRRNEMQGLSIREWPRMFRLDMNNLGIRPTRQNVASYRQFRGYGWDIQSRLVLAPQVAQGNVRIAREFFNNHPGQLLAYGNTRHTILRDYPTELVISELLAGLQTNDTDWENSYTIEYLARLLLGNRLSAMDVLLMSQGNVRDRSRARDQNGIEIENQVVNMMEGRSANYPGDRYMHNDRVQLQVHLVRLRGSEIVTTALALYLPEDPRYDLRYVVRDEVQ